jgi:hypothetical protein
VLVPIRAIGLSNIAIGLRKCECETMHGAKCGVLPFVLAWVPLRLVHACHNLHYGCGIGVALYVAAGLQKSERENVTHILVKSARGKCPFV